MNDNLHFAHVERPAQPPFQYKACGLDTVYLLSGYTSDVVAGHECFAVEDADDLHRAIAEQLVRHRKVLSGQEVRFLRKYMDLTQANLGSLLSVSDQTIARYEKDRVALEGSADTLLRIYVLGKLAGCVDPLQVVEALRSSDCPSRPDISLVHGDDGWRAAA